MAKQASDYDGLISRRPVDRVAARILFGSTGYQPTDAELKRNQLEDLRRAIRSLQGEIERTPRTAISAPKRTQQKQRMASLLARYNDLRGVLGVPTKSERQIEGQGLPEHFINAAADLLTKFQFQLIMDEAKRRCGSAGLVKRR